MTEYFSQFQDTTNALPCPSIFMYACESWTLIAELQRGVQAMEMRCYRKILRISHKDHIKKEVRAKIQQAIGPHEDLLTIVKRRRLQWYGHVSRSSGLAKTVLQGTVKGEEDKADRGRGGKTTSGNGQAWSSPSPRGQRRTGKDGGNWLRNNLWCPNDPRGWGIDDDDDDTVSRLYKSTLFLSFFFSFFVPDAALAISTPSVNCTSTKIIFVLVRC